MERALIVLPRREEYYRQAGYWSLAFELVAYGLVFALGLYPALVFSFPGLLFAISGLLKGSLKARICAAISLFIFILIAEAFIGLLTRV